MFFSNCLQLKLFMLRTASLSRQSTSSFSRTDILMRKNKHPVGFSALPGWMYLRGPTCPITVWRTRWQFREVQLWCKWGWSLAIQCASNGVLVPGGKLSHSLTTINSLIILRIFHGFDVISKDLMQNLVILMQKLKFVQNLRFCDQKFSKIKNPGKKVFHIFF